MMTDPTLDRDMQVLERARRGLVPNNAQRSAALARLGAALAAAPVAMSTPGSAEPPLPTQIDGTAVSRTFSLRALVVGIVGGLVLGFGAGHFVGRHSVAPPALARASTNVRPSEPAASTGVAGPNASEQASILEPQRTAPAPRATPGSAPPASAARARRRGDTSRQSAAPSANYDELSYVQRAQTALRNGDGALALGLMRSLDELQPAGALVPERSVLTVLALCQLGRVEEARSAATRALQGNEGSVYARRLETSCVGRPAAGDSDGSAPHTHQ
jgi:hypothetical protein